VPKNWAEDFNALLAKQKFSVTIRIDEMRVARIGGRG
jgi:hypothetical protein